MLFQRLFNDFIGSRPSKLPSPTEPTAEEREEEKYFFSATTEIVFTAFFLPRSVLLVTEEAGKSLAASFLPPPCCCSSPLALFLPQCKWSFVRWRVSLFERPSQLSLMDFWPEKCSANHCTTYAISKRRAYTEYFISSLHFISSLFFIRNESNLHISALETISRNSPWETFSTRPSTTCSSSPPTMGV